MNCKLKINYSPSAGLKITSACKYFEFMRSGNVLFTKISFTCSGSLSTKENISIKISLSNIN